MAFTRLNANLENISVLPDRPTPDNGYDAASVKAEFDKAGLDIKAYINTGLIAELESTAPGLSGSDSIGSTVIPGLDGSTVHSQLSALKSHIDSSVANALIGTLPDGSITGDKLSDELVEGLTTGGNLKVNIYNTAGEYIFTAPKDGIYRLRLLGAGGNGTMKCKSTDSGEIECPGGSGGCFAECFVFLKRNSSATVTVGEGGLSGAAQYDVDDHVSLEDFNKYPERFISSAGGNTSFGSDQVGFSITCPGGNSSEQSGVSIAGSISEDTSLFGHIIDDFIIEKRGDFCRYDIAVPNIKESTDGADSQFGCGGRYLSGRLPSCGAGGAGGKWIHSLQNVFVIKRLPQKGGDGTVIIEYIGME